MGAVPVQRLVAMDHAPAKQAIFQAPHAIGLVAAFFMIESKEMKQAVGKKSFEFLPEGKAIFFGLGLRSLQADNYIS